jgi:molybdate/tungstate transport system substrate-binding protein
MKLSAITAFLILFVTSVVFSGDWPRAVEHGDVVSVLYAGSLASLLEKTVGPAFSKKTGYTYQGEGQGSTAAARMIREKLRQPDVFISADPAVNSNVLMGPANGDAARWFITFAAGELVIGYNPASRFSKHMAAAAAGRMPWFQVIGEPGFQFGRTDPDADPKGYRAIFLFRLAAEYYHQSSITDLLGPLRNSPQIFPEPELLARLEAGQLDAGVFYKHEVLAQKIPFIPLPDQINQGSPAFAQEYALQSYKTERGTVFHGSPILFTVTIPASVHNLAGAIALVRYLTAGDGKPALEAAGLRPVPLLAAGDTSSIPPEIRAPVTGTYKQ